MCQQDPGEGEVDIEDLEQMEDELEIFRNERHEFKARAEGRVGVGRGGNTVDRGKEL